MSTCHTCVHAARKPEEAPPGFLRCTAAVTPADAPTAHKLPWVEPLNTCRQHAAKPAKAKPAKGRRR